MKKNFYLFLFVLLFGAITVQAQTDGDYQSNGTVTLTSATNWQTYSGGGWIAATTAPSKATLIAGNTITIVSGDTWNNGSAAIIPEGVTLLFQGTGGYFTTNTLTINGTYIHASATLPSVVFNGINATTGLGANSTVIYRASASYPTPVASFGGRVYNNLTFETDGTTTTEPAFASPGFTSALTINGTLTIDSWKADFHTSGNTTAVNLNGSVVLKGSGSYLRIRTTTIAVGQTLTIGATDSLGVDSASALTVNGTLLNQSLKPINFTKGGTIVVNGTLQHDVNGGAIPNTTATYNTGSTILVTGITTVTTFPALPSVCGNVTWNCTGQTTSNTFVNTTTNSTVVNGNLTILSTGTATIYLGAASTARTLTVNGNLIVSGGNLSIIRPATGATGNQTCTVNGDVIVSGGSCYVASILKGATGYTGKGYLTMTGSLNHTGGVFGMDSTTTAGTGVLSFTTANTDKTITTTGINGNIAIVIDKTAAGWITLNSSVVLWPAATVTFTSGSLSLAAGIVLQTTPTAISGVSSTSYIIINTSAGSAASLKMTGITAATVFPVGTAAAYLPVTITPASSSDFSVGVFQGVTTDATPNDASISAIQLASVVDAVWLVNRTSSNTDNATVSVNWPDALEGTAFEALGNDIGLGSYANGTWNAFEGSGDNTANTATATVNAFSAFTVGQVGTSLPVVFASLGAVASGSKINIDWQVANETNIARYVVERSADGIAFNALDEVTAKGAGVYSATDLNPLSGNNFYRIEAVSTSGVVRYSSMVKVDMDGKSRNVMLVYPNPVANKTINLQLTGLDEDTYQLLLLDERGQTVYSKQLGKISSNQSLSLPLQQGMASGIYQVVIKGNAQQLHQTVIIQ